LIDGAPFPPRSLPIWILVHNIPFYLKRYCINRAPIRISLYDADFSGAAERAGYNALDELSLEENIYDHNRDKGDDRASHQHGEIG